MLPRVIMTYLPGDKLSDRYEMGAHLVHPNLLTDTELAILIRDRTTDPVPGVIKKLAAKELYHRHNGWVPETHCYFWNVNSVIEDLLGG